MKLTKQQLAMRRFKMFWRKLTRREQLFVLKLIHEAGKGK